MSTFYCVDIFIVLTFSMSTFSNCLFMLPLSKYLCGWNSTSWKFYDSFRSRWNKTWQSRIVQVTSQARTHIHLLAAHTNTHSRAHTRTHIHLLASTHTHTWTLTHTHAYERAYERTHARTNIYTHTHTVMRTQIHSQTHARKHRNASTHTDSTDSW